MDFILTSRKHFGIMCYFIAFTLLATLVKAQNLIPNPGFEFHENHMNLAPALATEFLLDWYPCNRLSADPFNAGTPDYYDNEYPYASSNGPSFWNIVLGASEGEHYVGLGNHVLYAGYYTPEALSIKLSKTLEAGKVYQLGLSARNKGVATYNGKAPEFCEIAEDRRIEVLLSSDSIFVDIDAMNNSSWNNAQKSINFRSSRLVGNEAGYWDKLGTCIESDGTENFIAFTMPSGSFEVESPCIIQPDHWDVFYTYYYDLDDLQLVELPDSYDLLVEICEKDPEEIDIVSLLELPVMQNEIRIVWPDGHIHSNGKIEAEGEYELSVILDCTTIPLFLTVKKTKCAADIYVANTFTPNGDFINDELAFNISVELPIEDYNLEIYDRWGSLVYSSRDRNDRWDGKHNGRDLLAGTYSWNMNFHLLNKNGIIDEIQKQGTVTLVR